MRLTRRAMLCALVALPLAALLVPTTARADALDELRAAGKVGERYDGMAVALSPDAKSLVDEVNKKRRKIYEQKAAAQGVSVESVGKVYASQIMKSAPKGTKFQNENGNWIAK